MFKLLYKLMDVLSNNTVRNMMGSLGLGLVSGAAIYAIISQFVTTAVTEAYNLPYLGLLGLFGIDKALAIILGAVLTRAAMDATNVRFTRK